MHVKVSSRHGRDRAIMAEVLICTILFYCRCSVASSLLTVSRYQQPLAPHLNSSISAPVFFCDFIWQAWLLPFYTVVPALAPPPL